MAKRSYDQYCPAAKALDLVGERWTLLLVRELLLGPRRYGDLLEALPGIGTNLLAERLRRLEEANILRRRRLDPPAGSTVYELTEEGRELEPVLLALGRFGLGMLGRRRRGEAFRPEWLALGLRSAVDLEAAAGLHETYEVRIDGEPVQVQVDDGEVRTRPGAATDPDVVVETDAPTLVGVGTGELSPEEATASGGLKVEGDPTALEHCVAVLGAVRA